MKTIKPTLYTLIVIFIGVLVNTSNAFGQAALKESMLRGEELYISNCVSCHMRNGEGIKTVFPPLAQSDYLMEDQKRAIQQVLYGAKGEMTVNGVMYNGEMSAYDIGNQQVADILNYIQNSWGNKATMLSAEDIQKARK